jgi:hypothetical protein
VSALAIGSVSPNSISYVWGFELFCLPIAYQLSEHMPKIRKIMPQRGFRSSKAPHVVSTTKTISKKIMQSPDSSYSGLCPQAGQRSSKSLGLSLLPHAGQV